MPTAKAAGAEIARRLLVIIRSIPVTPESIDTNRIRSLLRDEGFDAPVRTVQRDLERLAAWHEGELRVLDGSPARFSWEPHALLAPVARLTTHQILLMRLIERHLRHALPTTVTKVLAPAFDQARRQGLSDAAIAGWAKKVRFEAIGYHPEPPTIRSDVQAVLYDALLTDRACRVTYRRQVATSDETLDIDPVGLLVRDSVLALFAVIDDEGTTRELRLDRVKSATLVDRRRRASTGRVDLASYVPGGKAIEVLGSRMRVEMLVEKTARLDAIARPFSSDQTIEEHDAARRRHAFTAPNSAEFVAWLRGYGSRIQVLAPPQLVKLLAEDAERAAANYRDRG